MKEKILAIVEELQQEREARHVKPSHVLVNEIINRGCHEPYKAINELCAEGKLRWCRTINGVAFTIVRNNQSKQPCLERKQSQGNA